MDQFPIANATLRVYRRSHALQLVVAYYRCVNGLNTIGPDDGVFRWLRSPLPLGG